MSKLGKFKRLFATSSDHLKYSDLRFHEKLGVGGYGTVYKVTLKTPVKGFTEAAAKVATEGLPQEEAKILSRLEHPNVVTLLGVCQNGPITTIVLEYAPKGSLRDYLKKHESTPLSDDLIEKWTTESALAIQYLHQNNIIHRDVKSSNCLLFEDNLLKLTDFGLAREIEHSETTSTEKGTYRYMAPEIIRPKKGTGRATYSKRTDVYAYGMLTLEICTRRVPYEGKEWQYITFHVASGNLKPTVPPDCPEKLAHIMKKCWQLDPRQRPSIDEIVQDLTTSGAAAFHIQHWSLDKEFYLQSEGLLANRVACCPNGDIIVADLDNSRLYLINADGTYKQDMKRAESQEPLSMHAYDLTVTSQGKILVQDANCRLLVFDINGMQLPSFSTLTADEDPNTQVKVTGLCVDRDDNILVGAISLVRDSRRGVITIHEPDGQIMDKICINNDDLRQLERIAVSSKKHILHYSRIIGNPRCILATNYKCEHVFTINPTIPDANIVIVEVVLDSDDNVYVAMHEVQEGKHVLNTGRIHKYNNQGVFLECIAQSLYWPQDLSITSDGSLIVANVISILTYSKK